MLILRATGIILMLLATGALAYDGARILASRSGLIVTSLREHWAALDAASLKLSQDFIQQNLHPYLWDPIAATFLSLPAWLALGLAGAALFLLGYRRKPPQIVPD